MQNFLFSFNAIFPVAALILLGYILRKTKFISADFISNSSMLVFRIALPVLIFRNIARTDFSKVFNGEEIFLSVGMTIIIYFIAWFFAGKMSEIPAEQGPFVQGAFRGNVAIVGTAIAMNIYGPEGAARVAMHVCFLMPLYNILAVIVLTVPMGKNNAGGWQKILLKIITNPLIIAVVVSLPFSIYSIPIPVIFQGAIDYTAQLTLPLALLGIGGSLSFSAFGKHPVLAVIATALKLIILPASTILMSVLLKLNIQDPGILFLLMGAPTAVSSFIMTKEMGSDEVLQANIIALTSFVSMFTLGLGIFILRTLGMI
ncbi:MAG: AEC family transporter [Spirochaetales bacterium]|nr:AEC family transporter [Spirochaetales bacterium]